MGRTGVNVLSPVRMADRPPPKEDTFPSPTRADRVYNNAPGSQFAADESWMDESEQVSPRLRFPQMKEDDATQLSALKGAVSVDAALLTLGAPKEPRTMVYSRSQDLHGVGVTGTTI